SRQDGVLTLAANNGKTLDPSLTAAYVRDMADSLDVAKGYRRLLGSKLVESDPEYLTRKKLFSEQMPATGLLSAFTSTLRRELSEDAFVFINHVLN
ncbi:dermonecrotic toxin domain-containing protein, partial [Pseudomonas viridiflava]|uniref:dermonecrotic toxin domain-containing protein n=1 Tax=Pseudomonas viridiflava TaxID=33069 RepID=UPI0013E09BE1